MAEAGGFGLGPGTALECWVGRTLPGGCPDCPLCWPRDLGLWIFCSSCLGGRGAEFGRLDPHLCDSYC